MRARKPDGAGGTLYTIGHSTRTTRELVELLRAHGVEQVVDVRTMPKSRHNPQFNRPALARSLHAAKIGYRHVKTLGGLRHAQPDSINLGWRNASFRGFADYMQTEDFVAGLAVADRGRAHGGPVASAPYPEPSDRPASQAHALPQGALRQAPLASTRSQSSLAPPRPALAIQSSSLTSRQQRLFKI